MVLAPSQPPVVDHLRGVFSSQELRKIGTGTTTRRIVQKNFWYADEDAATGKLYLQPLNANYVPSGARREISRDELLEKYAPEPEFYIQSVYPKMRELDETVNRADHMRAKGESFSAEFEYNNALEVDVENVRANFGIGLTYLNRGETAKAENIFERLVNLEAAFEEEHKHLFNEFGINLRKNKMFLQALEYYTKAEELSTADENLCVNVARVYLELQDMDSCLKYLGKALVLAPTNETALKFLAWIQAKSLASADKVDKYIKMAQNDADDFAMPLSVDHPQIKTERQPAASSASPAPSPSSERSENSVSLSSLESS